jgi:uncharacterized protein (TIGR02466 family)
MGSQAVFPTLIYTANLGTSSKKLNQGLLHDIEVLRRTDGEGIKWSKTNYVGGYTSYNSIVDLHQRFPDFVDLEKKLNSHVNKYIKSLNWDLQGRKVKMTTCWVNVVPQNTYHSLHIHPLSVISGTYYVKIPKGASSLKIEDPNISKYMNCPPRKSAAPKTQQPYLHFTPKAGDMILFESWMRHEVPPNPSKEDRISVSFNYEWI